MSVFLNIIKYRFVTFLSFKVLHCLVLLLVAKEGAHTDFELCNQSHQSIISTIK